MRTAVITGASRGIGKATAEKFLSEGWRVIGTSTDGEGWQSENIEWIPLDLEDPGSVAKAAEAILSRGSFEVLINNAGHLDEIESAFGDLPIKRSILEKTLEINLVGTIDFTEQLVPSLRSGSHIISVGSILGSITDATEAQSPAYSISKAALSMYTRQLAAQLKEKGVTVSIVDPGWVRTDMGGPNAVREAEEPANEIYELATRANVPSGMFWQSGTERSW